MIAAVLAGPIHPALGNLVLSSVFYDRTIKLLDNIPHDIRRFASTCLIMMFPIFAA